MDTYSSVSNISINFVSKLSEDAEKLNVRPKIFITNQTNHFILY